MSESDLLLEITMSPQEYQALCKKVKERNNGTALEDFVKSEQLLPAFMAITSHVYGLKGSITIRTNGDITLTEKDGNAVRFVIDRIRDQIQGIQKRTLEVVVQTTNPPSSGSARYMRRDDAIEPQLRFTINARDSTR